LNQGKASSNATTSKVSAIARPGVPCAPPASLLPLPVSSNAEPRRSARIRKLHLAQGQQPLAAPEAPSHTEPRRSARLLKRRLEEDGQPEARPSKARRTTKRPSRVTK
jgi:hypothetical protein